MKILVIANGPAIKNMISEALSQRGHELIFITDGNEAWHLIKKREDIQLVIAELNMPGMSGMELCKKIRSLKCPYYIYIMLITSKNHKEEVISGIKVGANDILTKPFNPDELQIRILAGERSIQFEEDLLEKNQKLQMSNEILRGNLVSDVQEFMGHAGFSDDISIIGFRWLESRVT
jgi:DNA-binding response OmpR family regulator